MHYPLRLIRTILTGGDLVKATDGIEFQDNFSFVPLTDHEKYMREETTGYFKTRQHIEERLRAALISGTITLADLNYPPYWIARGF